MIYTHVLNRGGFAVRSPLDHEFDSDVPPRRAVREDSPPITSPS